MIAPMELMLRRVERYSADSDSVRFNELLYAGELIVKLTTAAFVACVENDREHHRYRLIHGLVRADGIGEWAQALDETLTGPASQHLAKTLAEVRRTFTERVGKGTWQYDAVQRLFEVVKGVYDGAQTPPDRLALRAWFPYFAELRNKTRGHGALTPATCARHVAALSEAIDLLCRNNPVFALPWAYLHRNLSGKYRVVGLGGDQEVFAPLKKSGATVSENYPNGVYVHADKFMRVELITTDLDATDFFVPNGAFRKDTYELHSLISDNRLEGDATPYLAAASERPPSETEGKGELDVLGRVLTNLPSLAHGYVARKKLEGEIHELLMNDRHPIVTLVGRGGIGKTSLVLSILHEVAKTDRYDVIAWFSARDIDLLMSGAKPVQPRVLTDTDIAEQYRAMIGAAKVGPSGKIAPMELMAGHLRASPIGPTLFVFDNFETVRSPIDLFHWIDTNIRLPNKVVITSRFREFKADYPVEVSGMEQDEAEKLASQTAIALHIEDIVGRRERDIVIEEADSHPYVMKIMLGEIANAGKFTKPSNLMARKEDILDALFERTYASLTPMAARIFLTLCGWRSLVPQLAVEAAILRSGNGGSDPAAAIDQIVRMSLVERSEAADGTDFLEVPLAAALFGKRKLEVSPSSAAIGNDLRFLQDIGSTTQSALKEGMRPRLEAYFRRTARRISEGSTTLDEARPVLEFLAQGYPSAWMLMSELEQELGGRTGIEHAAECIRRFLETTPPADQAREAWRQLVQLYQSAGNAMGGCGAFLKAAELAAPPLDEVSVIANWINNAPELKNEMELFDRRTLFKPLARLMEQHLSKASATDLSRLSWLYLHCNDERRALEVAELGLRRQPENVHCQRIVAKLTQNNE